MIYIVRINDKEYEVEVEKGQATLMKTTEVDEVQIPKATKATTPKTVTPIEQKAEEINEEIDEDTSSTEVASGTTAIKAPMPGTILAIKTTPGQSVKKGEVLLILEAMKMENEITAPEDGIISQILVTKGAAVSTNDILISMQ